MMAMPTAQRQAGPVRTVMAGAIGNALEWYDFSLFGYFAPVISSQFFPPTDARAALLNTFGVFAAGFLMRPIGAVMFGHLGDRMGRKSALGLSGAAHGRPDGPGPAAAHLAGAGHGGDLLGGGNYRPKA